MQDHRHSRASQAHLHPLRSPWLPAGVAARQLPASGYAQCRPTGRAGRLWLPNVLRPAWSGCGWRNGRNNGVHGRNQVADVQVECTGECKHCEKAWVYAAGAFKGTHGPYRNRRQGRQLLLAHLPPLAGRAYALPQGSRRCPVRTQLPLGTVGHWPTVSIK